MEAYEIESPCYEGGAPNFRDQVRRFFIPIYAPQRGKGWEPNNSLFTVWFGINDVFRVDGMGTASAYTTALIALYGELADSLYASGARRFLFFNVPPMDRMPRYPLLQDERIQKPGRKSLKRLIDSFNRALELRIWEFREKHRDATVFLFDAHTMFEMVLDKPSSYGLTAGIKNTTNACAPYANSKDEHLFDPACGVPRNEYFWADDVHPTSTVHRVIAEEVVKLLAQER